MTFTCLYLIGIGVKFVLQKFEGSGDALDGISLPDVASRSSSISGSQSHDRNSNSPPFIDVKCDEEDLLQELNCSYDATRGIGERSSTCDNLIHARKDFKWILLI
jgi:hypothetical protein